jgi:prepilin peptidase CpaA
MDASAILLSIWVLILLGGAFTDMRALRIPNIIPGLLILLFIAIHSYAGFTAVIWPNLLHFLVALAIGMLLFHIRWIGGGDAKFYAAAALWFDWKGAVALIFLTSVAGLLLAIILILARKAGLRKSVAKEDRRIPYGVAIAAGAIASAAWTGWTWMLPPL